MKQYLSRMDNTAKKIVALAYFHRYGWIVTMMVCAEFWTEHRLFILCTSCILFSIWSFVGYKRRWRHIYCSFQNSAHKTMTPHSVQWHQVKKSDACGIPLFFLVMGIAMLACIILE